MQIYLLPLVSALVASIASQAGVSGAFLLLPFQISVLGISSPVASSTNLLYNVISTPGGVYRFKKEGRLNIKLTAIILTGTIPGMLTGSYLRTVYLLNPEKFKIFAGVVLMYMALRLLLSKGKKYKITEISECKIEERRLRYKFGNKQYTISIPVLIVISYFVGIIAGAYGVGGGAFLTPILLTMFYLPVYTISGSILLSTFVTSCICSGFYGSLGYPPNLEVGILLGVGGLFGMYTGAKFQKNIDEILIKRILGVIVILISIKYLLPGILYFIRYF